MLNYPGYFITVEGGEGAGKTIQINKLKKHLESLGCSVVATREPGGVRVAEQIRHILLGPDVIDMDAMTEVLLYAAARREHVIEVIKPALKEGKVVISDRFFDTSLVYQGIVKGEGLDRVYNINMEATNHTVPDLTLYFDIEPRIALSRIHQNSKREINRFDKASLEFHDKVRKGYQSLLARFPKRFVLINAEQTIEEVFQEIINIVNISISKIK